MDYDIDAKLIGQLNKELNVFGIVDISVGEEKHYCVSRRRLLDAANEVCARRHFTHRYQRRYGKRCVIVLSNLDRENTLSCMDVWNHYKNALTTERSK